MNAEAHFDRGWLLVGQSRYKEAEKELRQALAFDPNHSRAHAMLALCHCHAEQYSQSEAVIRQAIHLDPDNDYVHYVNAWINYQRNRYREAMEAVREALRLDPEDPDYYGLLSAIHFQCRRWQDAVEAAEWGLGIDPEHVECINHRGRSLVKLGRKSEAGEAVRDALSKNPQDSDTHANLGWTLIEQGSPQEAQGHFREALRLDPENEWAREGIVEALKSRFFVYRILLSYFLWMQKLAQSSQWGITLGAFVGYQVLRAVARQQPQLAPFIWPLLIVYIAFCIMTWIAVPLFNLMLRLNRDGRMALSREQVITANWVGLCLLGSLLCFGLYFVVSDLALLMGALGFAMVIPPLSNIYHCHQGWPRKTLIAITVILISIGTLAIALLLVSNFLPVELAVRAIVLSLFLFIAFAVLAFLSQLASSFLVSQEPRR